MDNTGVDTSTDTGTAAGGIDAASIMANSLAFSRQVAQDTSTVTQAVKEQSDIGTDAISKQDAINAADAIISSTQEAAKYQLQKDDQAAAAAFGINMNASNSIISTIANDIATNTSRGDAALARIRDKQSVGFFDDPLTYIGNLFTINNDIEDYNTSEAEVDRKTALMQRLQTITQEQFKVNAATEEVNTAATVQAFADKTAAASALALDKIKYENLQHNIEGVKAIQEMDYRGLLIQHQALATVDEEKRMDIQQQEMDMHKQAFAIQLEERQGNMAADAAMIKQINLGLGVMGKNPVDAARWKVLSRVGGNALKQLQDAFIIGGNQAINGNSVLGTTPAAAGDVIIRNQLAAPASESPVANFITQASISAKNNPMLKGNVAGQEQAANEIVHNAIFGRVDPATGKPAGGWISNIDGRDAANIYNAPDVKSLANIPGFADTITYKNIIAPQLANGNIPHITAPDLVEQMYTGMKNGILTPNQFVYELNAYGLASEAINNATKQYAKYGLPPQSSFNVNLQLPSRGIFTPRITYDLTNPVDINNYLVKRMANERGDMALTAGSKFGL